MTRILACDADELADGEMKSFTVPQHGKIALYRVNGEWFATSDHCTHARASLSDEGILEDYVVTCTWHEGSFDIRTGRVVRPPCTKPLQTFDVTILDGKVFIEQRVSSQ